MNNFTSQLREGAVQSVRLPSIETYFTLEVFEYIDGAMGEERLYTIKENTNYVVFVQAHANERPRKGQLQTRRDIRGDGSLDLQCFRDSNRGKIESVIIAEHSCSLAYSKLDDDFEHSFIIAVTNKCETQDITFELYYQKEGKSRERDPVVTLQVRLEGTNFPMDQGIFKDAYIAGEVLQHPLPENTCIVYASMDQNNEYETWTMIHGWSSFHKSLVPKKIGKTPVTLAQLTEDKKDHIDEMIVNLKEYWRTDSSNLRDWLAVQWRKLALKEERLRVIFVDSTIYETPWEMLVLDDNIYLGAESPMVRWKPIHTFGENSHRYYDTSTALDISVDVGRRAVIAYVDKEDPVVQHSYPEQQVLDQANAEMFETIGEFEERLMKSLANVCLVYVGAHGSEGEEIGSRQKESDRITRLNLARKTTEKEWRPLFFFNTCHSAALKATAGGHKSGLLDVVMAYMACGYIGTLGAVKNRVATELAQQILEDAMKPEGVYVAEALRVLRKKIADDIHNSDFDELPENKKVELRAKFFSIFMYVYYGNLLTRLRLYVKPTKVEEEDAARRV